MTIEAQTTLVLIAETTVALGALGFVLGMTLNDRAGHHQCFDIGGLYRERQPEQQSQHNPSDAS